MKITVELSDKDAAEALKAAMIQRLEDTQLVTIAEAARLLGVSRPTVRALMGEWIDLGVQSPRIELSRVKKLINSRRVPA